MPRPYRDLNLTENPFGTLDRDQLGRVAIVDFDLAPIVDRLSRPGFAIQFLGFRGRGKSTHLSALHNQFSGLPLTYIPIGNGTLEIPQSPIVFVDELQRVPWSNRAALFRRPASFVIGSHWHHGGELWRAGVQFKTVWLFGLSYVKLRRIVETKIEAAVIDPARPRPEIPDALLRRLHRQHRDHIRAIQSALYDYIETLRH